MIYAQRHLAYNSAFHSICISRRVAAMSVATCVSQEMGVKLGLESYTISSSKVVFLKKRPQNRQFKGNVCIPCDRSLQEPYIHCSLGCNKVDYVLKYTSDLSTCLRRCEILQLSFDYLIPSKANETTNSTIIEGDEASGMSDLEEFGGMCTEVKQMSRCWARFYAKSVGSLNKEDMAANFEQKENDPS